MLENKQKIEEMELELEETKKFKQKLQDGMNDMCIWPSIRLVVAFEGHVEVVYGRFIWYFSNDGILAIWCNGGVCLINKDFLVSVKF
ncbi:hypothetical protein [Oceanirhabdus seepicola]|uniref:Uncharacterized protein n=1 Tax=Oceanirhabdus seepicola TaxID=2828781 RepID=A0A9J6NXB8_9CLOT|nr:hypothetical protein [Oceanirhabdus seepicola]MCM1989151.1 hypothetical protein [Oceanirhabdus seepicola]